MKSTIFYLKNKVFRRRVYKQYLEALKNENLSLDQLKILSFQKKKDIVKYAYENSDFYKKHYDNYNFKPSDLINDEDWDKVPVVTKDDIRSNYNKIIVNKNIKFGLVSTTGGSTGAPLKLLHDSRFANEVIGWRMLRWWGTSFGANFANIYRSKPRSFLNKLLWFPTLKINLDASSMSKEDMKVFVRKIIKTKPEIIQGYVGAIEQLANYIIDNNIKVPTPKMCWTTSSPVTSVQRSIMEKAFNCKVLDQYGCCEVYWLAQECTHQRGLHVNSDYRDITVIDESYNSIVSKGKIGRFAITDYYNKVFPIIKYLNGDEGSYNDKQCICGLPFPLLNPVKGRVTDCIYLPDKTIIGGDYLTTIFDDNPNLVKGFQVIQKRNGDLEIKYIPNTEYSVNSIKEIEEIKNILLIKTKKQVKVSFKGVENIPHDAGKNRYVINEMEIKNKLQ